MTESNRPTHPAVSHAELRAQAVELRLHGLLSHWDEVMGQAESKRRVRQWLDWESAERANRSLERRLRDAHIGRFKPLADFDWSWPTACDRTTVEELMSLQFLADASNVVLVGTNGVGKSMIAANIAHQAVLQGHTVLFTSAGQMLSELAALDSDAALRRRLQHYAAPDLLSIDEIGYLSYSNRHADMLFELISRRHLHKSVIITTNRRFADWGEVFPSAACVVSLVDRLMNRADVVRIEGESYRQKEAEERALHRAAARTAAAGTKATAKRKPSA